MNAPFASHPAAAAESDVSIGRSVKRTEDPILVQGHGRYTDDLSLPGQLHAVVVRSQHAHGVLNAIETDDARAMPGVVAIYTGADLAHYTPLKSPLPLKGRDGHGLHGNARPIFPTDKVRFVGDPVALVVAETERQARDAAEAVVLDITPLPAVGDGKAAIADGAPQLYDDVPRNISLDFHHGDTAAVDAAFAKAAHVTRLEIVNNRIVVSAMEPRAAIADYDFDEDRYVMHVVSQGVFGMRAGLAQALNVAPRQRARADRPCRRLVRHEGVGLSRICRAAPCRARPEAAREMDGAAARKASSPTIRAATTSSTRRSRSMTRAAFWRCACRSSPMSAPICRRGRRSSRPATSCAMRSASIARR